MGKMKADSKNRKLGDILANLDDIREMEELTFNQIKKATLKKSKPVLRLVHPK